VELNGLITQQIEMLERLIPADIELKLVPSGAPIHVRIDVSQMEQVVMNLIINARDAMPNGGEIIIETGNADLDQGACEPENAPEPGRFVMLAVSDNGCGMDAETKAHIFEPFFTTKEQGKGTGLGLATVFGIVNQNSGSIFVHSEPGHGTTFKIYLPHVGTAEQSEDISIPRGLDVSGDETILLVEDQEAVRESAAEYLEIAQQRKEPIHLLLTDVVMPHMSGRELSVRLTSIHPETKVIFMSGYSNNLLSNQQVLDPRHELLQKPFRLEALGQRIRETLSNRRAARGGK
jgi:CheY-like chemotaxis protein